MEATDGHLIVYDDYYGFKDMKVARTLGYHVQQASQTSWEISVKDERVKIMWLDTKGLIIKCMHYKTIKNVIDEILVEDPDSGILYVSDVDYKYKLHNVYFADVNRIGDFYTGGRWTPTEYYYLFSGALYNVLIIPATFYKLYPDAYEFLRFRLRGYEDKNIVIIEY